jgi:hypothetical protein
MTVEHVALNRYHLYKLLWPRGLGGAAKALGFTPNALRAACTTLHVPIPTPNFHFDSVLDSPSSAIRSRRGQAPPRCDSPTRVGPKAGCEFSAERKCDTAPATCRVRQPEMAAPGTKTSA